MIRALIFDFDGLILDTETPVIEAWAALHIEAGLPYAREDAAKIVGHVDIDFDPWTRFDPAVDRAQLEQEHRRRSRELLTRQPILPGVRNYLEDAQKLGLRVAIASNSTHPWVEGHLARLGLSGFFQAIKCREDVARGKPEPDVYEAALREFGISGAEAIAFEDSEAGSLAAKRAGCWCVAIPNPSTHGHQFSHVDLQVKTLEDVSLAELVRRFGADRSGHL